MLVATGLGAVASLPQAQAGQTRPLALIFPPWTSQQDAVARSFAAGHEILRSGVASFIVIAAPQGEGGTAVAKPEGAMLMLALDGLAGCLDSGIATETPP